MLVCSRLLCTSSCYQSLPEGCFSSTPALASQNPTVCELNRSLWWTTMQPVKVMLRKNSSRQGGKSMTYLSSENGRSQNNRRYSIRYIFILKKLDGYGNPLVVLFSFLCFLTFRIFGVLLEMNKCKKKILLVIGPPRASPRPLKLMCWSSDSWYLRMCFRWSL